LNSFLRIGLNRMDFNLNWPKATKMRAIGERLESDNRKPRMKVFSILKLMGCLQLL
jgi:hypothetical protein